MALHLAGSTASFEEHFKKRMLHTSDKEHKGIYTQLHSSHKCMRADIMGAKRRAPSASDDAREAEQEVARVEEKKRGGGVTLIDRWLPLSPPLVSDTLPVAPSSAQSSPTDDFACLSEIYEMAPNWSSCELKMVKLNRKG